jgi:hypothetical protein
MIELTQEQLSTALYDLEKARDALDQQREQMAEVEAEMRAELDAIKRDREAKATKSFVDEIVRTTIKANNDRRIRDN